MFNDIVTAIAVLALIGVALYVFFNSKKMRQKNAPPQSRPHLQAQKTDVAEQMRKSVVQQGNSVRASLARIFEKHAGQINALFKDLPAYQNAVDASIPFLYIFSRLLLISNGILNQKTPAIENDLDYVCRNLYQPNSSEKFNNFADYFQSFLLPNHSLPRCDIFFGNDEVFSGSPDATLVLTVALGDCIVNPLLVTEGPDAPLYIIGESIEIVSRMTNHIVKILDSFAGELYGHFIHNHDRYAIPIHSVK